jgi:hypothetical protein
MREVPNVSTIVKLRAVLRPSRDSSKIVQLMPCSPKTLGLTMKYGYARVSTDGQSIDAQLRQRGPRIGEGQRQEAWAAGTS